MAKCFFCDKEDTLASLEVLLKAESEAAKTEAGQSSLKRYKTDDEYRRQIQRKVEAEAQRTQPRNTSTFQEYYLTVEVPRCQQCKAYHEFIGRLALKLMIIVSLLLWILFICLVGIIGFAGEEFWKYLLISLVPAVGLGVCIAGLTMLFYSELCFGLERHRDLNVQNASFPLSKRNERVDGRLFVEISKKLRWRIWPPHPPHSWRGIFFGGVSSACL